MVRPHIKKHPGTSKALNFSKIDIFQVTNNYMRVNKYLFRANNTRDFVKART